MSDAIDEGAIQQTLDGDENDVDRAECEYYPGCTANADVMLEKLVYGSGCVDTPACESCKDEFREYAPEGRVRQLKPSERWVA